MSTSNTSRHSARAAGRRTLAGVGTLGLLGGTVMLGLGALSTSADAATSAPLKFACKATVFGTELDQGTWTAAVTVNLPAQVTVGSTIPAPAISAKVTTSTSAADTLRGLGITSVDGSSAAGYTVSGAARTANLTIPTTPVPSSGGLITTATGSGQSETAPATPGSIDVKVGNFTADIQTYQGANKSIFIPVKCTLNAGQDATVGSIKVVSDQTPTTTSTSTATSTTSTPTSTTSTPTSTTSTPTSTSSIPTSTTSTPTSTTEPTSTTSTTEPTSTTSEPTTGPSTPSTVQTDGGTSGDGVNLWTIGGVGAAAAGLVALAGAAVSNRRED